jgi:tetratricopeptide (TPR) repeat protein
VAKLGKTLYDAKAYADAEKAFKLTLPIMNDYGIITLLAKTLHRSGKKDEALKYYKQSYNQKKNGEIAYNIGILLAPQSNGNSSKADEAINYFLAASFLSPANTKKAMEYAQGLYFSQNPEYNEKVKTIQTKNKTLEDLTDSFNNKFGDKDEEDLTDSEKKEMEKTLSQIDSLQKEIEKIQAEQQSFLGKFEQLISQKKQELGIK